jgi:hypothetical protein
VDIEQALADGYRLLRVYEIYDWGANETTTDLFKPMIAHLIKGKVQSKAGAEYLSEENKSEMIKAWGGIGVDLREGDWRGSPAKYQFYKVLLNSLWGKLAQRVQGKTMTKIISEWKDLNAIIK